MRQCVGFTVAILIAVAALSTERMAQQRQTPVAPGVWGGTGIRIVIEKKLVSIEYDCAVGEIPQPLKVDRRGKFSVDGTHERLLPGALRPQFQPKPLAVRYEGTITGRTIKFKVVGKETDEMIGEFTARLGADAGVRGCR